MQALHHLIINLLATSPVHVAHFTAEVNPSLATPVSEAVQQTWVKFLSNNVITTFKSLRNGIRNINIACIMSTLVNADRQRTESVLTQISVVITPSRLFRRLIYTFSRTVDFTHIHQGHMHWDNHINVPKQARRICLNKSHGSTKNNWHWGLGCQKHESRTGTSNYIPQYLWDVITCPCPWYLLQVQKYSIR